MMILNDSIRSTAFTGIVLESIFPFISFLYLHKNYISEKEKIPPDKIQEIRILGWALPPFFLHVIIMFGFNIVILPHFNNRVCRLMDAVKTNQKKYRKTRWRHAQ